MKMAKLEATVNVNVHIIEKRQRVFFVEPACYGKRSKIRIVYTNGSTSTINLGTDLGTAGDAVQIMKWSQSHKPSSIYVDTAGVGLDLFNILRDLKYPVKKYIDIEHQLGVEKATTVGDWQVILTGRIRNTEEKKPRQLTKDQQLQKAVDENWKLEEKLNKAQLKIRRQATHITAQDAKIVKLKAEVDRVVIDNYLERTYNSFSLYL